MEAVRHLLAILISASSALAAVPEKWVTLITTVESGNRADAVGDGTRARGLAQFWRPTWDDCSRVRAAQGLPTWSYGHAHDPVIGAAYARSWLNHLEARLARALGRPPTIGELYAAHNLGFTGFARRGYQLTSCPAITRSKAAWLAGRVGR